MTWSLDQGATFSKNIRLTNVSSDPQAGSALFVPGYRAGLLGEYIGLSTRSGKRAAPVWVDTRNGNQDTYFALPDSTRFSVQFTTPTPSVPRGGMLTANYVVTNNGSRRLDAQAWVNVYLKNGSEYPGNPYKGPVPAPIAPGQQKSGSLEFKVPQNAPVGKGYRLELCTGYYPYFVLGSQNFEFEITGS
jgi:hypothetical protein